MATGRTDALQPICKSLWTEHMIAAIATILETPTQKNQVVVIAYYSQPGLQDKLDGKLLDLLTNVRANYRKLPLICCGDFNRPLTKMELLSRQLDLSLMLQVDATVTRT